MFSLCLANAVCGFESAIYICSFFFLYFSNILFIVGFDAAFCLRRKENGAGKDISCKMAKFRKWELLLCSLGKDFLHHVSSPVIHHFSLLPDLGESFHRHKRWGRSHLSVARKESQSRVPARREPSSCFHAPYHYLSWSLFWFWSWRSSVWWGIFIFGLPATSVIVKGTRRNIRPSPMRKFRCKRWKLPPILPFFKDKRRMESRLNTTTSASSEDNSSQATAIFVHKKWCCSAT